MSKSNLKHLEKIEDAIKNSNIKEDEKSLALQKIKEWYIEDKAQDIIYDELVKISSNIEPILKELGLI